MLSLTGIFLGPTLMTVRPDEADIQSKVDVLFWEPKETQQENPNTILPQYITGASIGVALRRGTALYS